MNQGLNTVATATLNTSEEFSQEKVDLIKRTICVGATNDELALFVQVCQKTGLDPFARQIYAVKRWDAKAQREIMGVQTSIDGFRLIAERSGHYAGQVGPFWSQDGREWLEVWLHKDPPAAARVGILRHDFKEPLWAVATWNEYKQTKKDGGLMGLWAKMPALMLAKVAEALGLRRAFPQELSGLYTREEMDQAGGEEVLPPSPGGTPAPKPSVRSKATLPPASAVVGVIVGPEVIEAEVVTVTQPATDERGWGVAEQGAFASMIGTDLYNIFKEGGHPEMHQKEADLWRGRKATGQAREVLQAMEDRIQVLKAAAKARAKAAAPVEVVKTPEPVVVEAEPVPALPQPGSTEYAKSASEALKAQCLRFQTAYEAQGMPADEAKKKTLEMRDQCLRDVLFQGNEHPDEKKLMLANAMQHMANRLKVAQ